MIALMDDDDSTSHRSSLLRRNISNISSSGELGGSSTKGILKHSSSYPSFGEVESGSPVHEILPTIESKEDTAESNIEDKEDIRRRGKRDEDRSSISKQVDLEQDMMNKVEHMNDEGTTDIVEEGGGEVVEGSSSIAKQDGKVDTAEVDMNKAETVTANQDLEEVREVGEAADLEKINNNYESLDEEVAKQEADDKIEGEGMIVPEDDGDKEDEYPTTAEENSNRRTSPSSFATKSTEVDEEEDPTDEGKTTDDEINSSFSLRDLGCDHAKYLSIKNDIRSASSSVLRKL